MNPLALLPMVQTWEEIQADFGVNWLIYLSMPFIAAFIGYATKLVALQMLYRPLEHRGIGPLGWQGVVPRRAGKTAAVTIETLTENLLRPEEILERVDAREAVEELREPLMRTVEEVARELADQVRPGAWDALPATARAAVQRRVAKAAPDIIDRLLADIRQDMGGYIDLQHVSVTILVKNKKKLNDLVKGLGGSAMAFIRRSGIWFGFVIGLVQMVAWAYFQNPWIMPAFGFFTGFFSDWLALNLIFIPRDRRKLFGLIPVHGVVHAKRDEVTRDYARIMATDLFSADVLFEALLNGPTSDRLIAAFQREIARSIDAQLGVVRPVVNIAVGTTRYRTFKKEIVDRLLERMPDTVAEAKAYADRTLDIENLIVEKMNQLTPEQYEGILRPVFKDDEWLMISVGAVLGFLVGELQVLFVEHYSQTPH